MPEGSGESFRMQGELEKAHPDIEPLPPTPISPETKTRFEGWGVPENYITKLQELASSFRYDLCTEKAERTARNGGYTYENTDGSEEVLLPDFISSDLRLDGQCYDISVQLLRSLHSSGFLTELNDYLRTQGKPILEPHFLRGKSRTHFVKEDQAHVWIGLLPEGGNKEDIVSVDASFQELSNTDTNGYSIKEDTQPLSLSVPSSAVVRVDSTFDEDTLRIDTGSNGRDGTIIGRSFDSKYVYALSFAKNTKRNTVMPLLDIFDSNGERKRTIGGINGKLFHLDEVLPEGDPHYEEERQIISWLYIMPLVRDQSKASELKTKSVTVDFNASVESQKE